MNRKREEELMQMAFGDLRREMGSRAAEIDKDPDAAKTYQAYCEMRDGLKALRDIPEMQLSTERLRDAILREGLHPKRGFVWNWSWITTPLAVGACAFVVVTMIRKPASPIPGGNIVSNGQPMMVGMNEASKPDLFDTTFDEIRKPIDFGESIMAAAPVKEEISPRVVRVRQTNRREADKSPVLTLAMATKPIPGLSSSLAKETSAPSLDERPSPDAFVNASFAPTPATMKTMAMTSFAAKSADAGEIVQIESKMDAESGAAKATEVKANQNVEIGG